MDIIKKPDSLEKAAMIMLATRMSVKCLGMISTLFLVRLISPEDFGLVAISMAIYGFVEIFGLFGFHNALVQHGNPTEDDYNVVFTFSFIFGLSACLILNAISPIVSAYYGDVRMEETLLLVSTVFFINGCKNVKTVIFQIEMNFKREFYFQIIPKFISFFITILLAFMLMDYRALLYGTIVSAVVTVLVSYAMVPYKPNICLAGSRKLWNFSKWLMLNSMLQYFNSKVVDLVVGKFISVRAVGLYTLSSEMSYLALAEVSGPINKASFAAYSKVKRDKQQVKRLFEKTTSMTAIISMPMCAGLFVTSEYFVPVVFGNQWLDAVPLMQIMSITCLISVVTANSGYVLLSMGKSKVNFFISLSRAILFFPVLFFCMPRASITSAAWSSLFATTVCGLIAIAALKLYSGIGYRVTFVAVWRPFISSIALVALLTFTKYYIYNEPSLLFLLSQIVLGALAYLTVLTVLWISSGFPNGFEYEVLSKFNLIKYFNIKK
jgi:O-antigen/teichoic acid export membrane protein